MKIKALNNSGVIWDMGIEFRGFIIQRIGQPQCRGGLQDAYDCEAIPCVSYLTQ